MKNADRFKTMTDEELALMLMCPAEYDNRFNKSQECNCNMRNDCFKCTLNWLQRDVK